jgi:hypothetical protein
MRRIFWYLTFLPLVLAILFWSFGHSEESGFYGGILLTLQFPVLFVAAIVEFVCRNKRGEKATTPQGNIAAIVLAVAIILTFAFLAYLGWQARD